MNEQQSFIPALGRPEFTEDYDAVIAVMTRERRWRSSLMRQLSPQDGDVIVDIGAGTGSQAIAIKQLAPNARVFGIDPDPAVLEIARRKAMSANVDVTWVEGFGDQAPELIGTAVATKALSSLVLHQCDLEVKRAILVGMAKVLIDGGLMVVADYGQQRSLLMKLLYRQVQALDGWERTGLNAKGILPVLMGEVGFRNVIEAKTIPTPTGSISIYTGRSPSSRL